MWPFFGKKQEGFPQLPISYDNLKSQVRNGLSLPGRQYWWPRLPSIHKNENITQEINLTVKHDQARHEIDQRQRRNLTDHDELMRILVEKHYLTAPDLIYSFIQIIVNVIPAMEIRLQLVEDMLHRSDWYLAQKSESEYRIQLQNFRDLVIQQLKNEASAFQKIGVLQEDSLNEMFAQFYINLLPECYIQHLIDNYLLDGIKVLYKFGLAILKRNKDILQNVDINTSQKFWREVRIRADRNLFTIAELKQMAFSIGSNGIIGSLTSSSISRSKLRRNSENYSRNLQESDRAPLNLPYQRKNENECMKVLPLMPPVAVAIQANQLYNGLSSPIIDAGDVILGGEFEEPIKQYKGLLRHQVAEDNQKGSFSRDASKNAIIAIDFGTSRSAYAYYLPGKNVVVNAPKNSTAYQHINAKAATTIVLDEKQVAVGFGSLGKRHEYLQHPNIQNRYLFHQFKMKLKDIASSSHNPFIEDATGKKLPLLTVLAEAINYIATSALDDIKENEKNILKKSDIQWVLTIPAEWDEVSSNLMRKAAMRAGLIDHEHSEQLMLVKEPEAGSEELLELVEKREIIAQLKIGDEILILDCGGGTNDMSYIRVVGSRPLCCEQTMPSGGGTIGAALLDNYFENLLETLFGTGIFVRIKSLHSYAAMLDDWENTKMVFKGGENEQSICSLVDCIYQYNAEYQGDEITVKRFQDLVNQYNRGKKANQCLVYKPKLKIVIPTFTMTQWFSSIAAAICDQLKGQLDKKECNRIEIIYLIGGFCSNDFFRNFIKSDISNYCASRNRRIIVAESNSPALAIVKGAVIKLIRSRVAYHAARETVGIKCVYNFDPQIHPPAYRECVHGEQIVTVLHKFITKNSLIPVKFETPQSIFYPFDVNHSKATIELFNCDISDDRIIYWDDHSLRFHKVLEMTIPFNMSVPYEDRMVKISLNVDNNNPRLVCRDKSNNLIKNYQAEFFARLPK